MRAQSYCNVFAPRDVTVPNTALLPLFFPVAVTAKSAIFLGHIVVNKNVLHNLLSSTRTIPLANIACWVLTFARHALSPERPELNTKQIPIACA